MIQQILVVCCCLVAGCSAATVRDLRCEGRNEPLGIDAARPRFSWIVDADGKADRQTAYQVLVATESNRLSEDKADLWNGGKVSSLDNFGIAYLGKALGSEMRAVWRVRVWDRFGKASAWSEPAAFSVGLLKAEDWKAMWIGATDRHIRVAANGFHAAESKQDEPKWVQVDLGSSQAIDEIRLYPAFPNNWAKAKPGFGFPPAGRIEISDDPSFAKAKTIAKWEDSKPLLHGNDAVVFDAKKNSGRFVRVTSDHLWRRDDGSFCFALAELEAMVAGKNVALGKSVTAKDAVENANGWARYGLTDGHSPSHPGDARDDYAAPILRKKFALKKPIARATLYLCGLGYAIPDINGRRIGTEELDPGFTQFNKHVLYTTHDVTRTLVQGNNEIHITLGGGWFDVAQPELFGFEHAPWNAPVKMICRLSVEFADGSRTAIVSDKSWEVSTGEIRYNDIRAGATIDFNHPPAEWKPALVVPAPDGKLVAENQPPIRIDGEIPAVELTEPQAGVYQFKLAENTAGWPRLRVTGTKGQKISLRCAEEFTPDGKIARGLNQHTYGRYQTDEFVLADDKPAVLQPNFTYHGFQYVRVEGLTSKPKVEDLVGLKVHTVLEPAGSFECSNGTINQIHQACVRTYLSNLHGIPTDCPQREKAGWMADGLVASAIGMWNFRADCFYAKWIRDMRDAQLADGNVPSIIPNPGWGDLLDPWWGGASVMLPWDDYLHYGDQRVLRDQFPAMKKYVDYLTSKAKDHIVEFLMGDWLEVGTGGIANRTPVALTSTIGYYRCAKIASDAARLLGHEDDAKKYADLARQIRTAFNKKFLDEKNNRYCVDSQSAPAMALLFGLAPEDRRDAIFANLVENIEKTRKGHISTGLVATRYLIELLHAKHRDDLVYTMLMQKDFPGWIHMLTTGDAKTIWESWDGNSSRNHPALGCVDLWFYEAIGGITPDAGSVAFDKVTIAPQVLGDITWARTHHDTVRGRIATEWKIEEGKRFKLDVEIPVGTSATVIVPGKDGAQSHACGAGKYSFVSEIK